MTFDFKADGKEVMVTYPEISEVHISPRKSPSKKPKLKKTSSKKLKKKTWIQKSHLMATTKWR
jgi:hypothetical protein